MMDFSYGVVKELSYLAVFMMCALSMVFSTLAAILQRWKIAQIGVEYLMAYKWWKERLEDIL